MKIQLVALPFLVWFKRPFRWCIRQWTCHYWRASRYLIAEGELAMTTRITHIFPVPSPHIPNHQKFLNCFNWHIILYIWTLLSADLTIISNQSRMPVYYFLLSLLYRVHLRYRKGKSYVLTNDVIISGSFLDNTGIANFHANDLHGACLPKAYQDVLHIILCFAWFLYNLQVSWILKTLTENYKE